MFEAITTYIPQRPPILMVDQLISCDENQTKSIFKVEENNIFVEKGYLTEPGIIENIAQTCAARMGYLDKDQPVKIGVIGSVDNVEIFLLPQVGETLETTITIKSEVMNVVLISASTGCGDKLFANCSMKIVITDTESQMGK